MHPSKKKSKVFETGRNAAREVKHLDSDDEDEALNNEEEVYIEEDPYGNDFEEEEVIEETETNDEIEVEDASEEKLNKLMQELQIKANETELKYIKEEEEAKKERLGINSKLKVFNPNEEYNSKEYQLTFDNSAYEVYYKINCEWPALSFDIVSYPEHPTNYPLSCYFIAGSQVDSKIKEKQSYFIKTSEMFKTQYDSDVDSDVDDEEILDDEPVVEFQTIPMTSNVNRVRCMPQRRTISAFWCEDGKVYIYDTKEMFNVLKKEQIAVSLQNISNSKTPIQILDHHSTEGFALDWSKCIEGRLATGDCKGDIFVYDLNNMTNLSWNRYCENPFVGHYGSVEDIQFSPNEQTVFSTCSCDKTVKFWDVRRKNRKSALGFQASDTDVNVISWNPTTTYLIASGDDNGIIRVWDIRNCSDSTPLEPVAQFEYHKHPISSVEWHPTESTLLAASDEQQVTIWDLSLERDDEQENIEKDLGDEVPPQLLFVHLGQTNFKEVHWHPKLKSVLVTTSFDGFSLFKPSNLSEDNHMEEDDEDDE
ncbi:hypothetical protein ABK040_005419 [Willaertia magna]